MTGTRLPFATSALSLGTVQLGLPYGIANSSGAISAEALDPSRWPG